MIYKKDVILYCSNSISSENNFKFIAKYHGVVILGLTLRIHFLLYKHKEKHFKRMLKIDNV
jgi:hypothetical protein